MLHRRDVVRALLADRGDLLVIAGLGAPAWDITDAGDVPENYPLWGAMGGAVAIALGLALAQPDRRVLCITGDGEMLMGVGSLATVATMAPTNLSIAVLDNERYGETGQQRTATAFGVNLDGVASAMGFPVTLTIRAEDDVAELRSAVHGDAGPVFADVKVDPEKLPLVLPPRESAYLKNRFRLAVLGKSALSER